MLKIKAVSLFSGIGAFEKALRNIGVEVEIVNYCEIDSHAAKCYSVLHGVPESLNLVDVREADGKKMGKFDLLTHGSPCQSFSAAGKQEGGVKGSGTSSSLLWETVRIVTDTLPKYVVWENVKNVLAGKHRGVLDEYLEEMEKLGYVNYIPKDNKGKYTALNAKDYGIPQSRERVFIVSIRKDVDKGGFEYPKGVELKTGVEDYIDFREKDDLTDAFYRRYVQEIGEISREGFREYIEGLPVRKGIGTKKMGLYNFGEMDTITMPEGLTGTLTCRNVQNNNKKYLYEGKLYRPSPRMCWRLMGFTDEDFDKVAEIGRDSDLWNRAGNSIVVQVLEGIFKELFKDEL